MQIVHPWSQPCCSVFNNGDECSYSCRLAFSHTAPFVSGVSRLCPPIPVVVMAYLVCSLLLECPEICTPMEEHSYDPVFLTSLTTSSLVHREFLCLATLKLGYSPLSLYRKHFRTLEYEYPFHILLCHLCYPVLAIINIWGVGEKKWQQEEKIRRWEEIADEF